MRRAGLLILSATLALGQKTAWDGAYTDAQAARGETFFARNCSGCHVLATTGRAPLVGDPFWKSFSQKSVGDVLEYVRANMPNGNPRSLRAEEYEDIVAQLLKANGFPAGNGEIKSALEVRVVPRDGSSSLPAGALARVVGCLVKSGTEWTVTRATSPERAEGVAKDEGTRALGGRTVALKFVLTRLDPMAGARVAVTGLLMGADGADGINVTTVNPVAPTCP